MKAKRLRAAHKPQVHIRDLKTKGSSPRPLVRMEVFQFLPRTYQSQFEYSSNFLDVRVLRP